MDNNSLKEKISKLVEESQDRLIEICSRLINIPSVTGDELKVQLEVQKLMMEMNMETDFWIPDDREIRESSYFSENGESFQNRPVVVGILKGQNTGKGKSLLINGHVDVVTPEPLDKWKTNPFQAIIKEGKLYGRGASDMKGGLGMAMFCAELLTKKIGRNDGDITIVSVPAEENGGNGTAASLLRGYTKADGAIFPEPTSNQIQPAHRGAAFWRIYIDGKASHGGTKYKGISAVEKGIKIAQVLIELEKVRNETICSKEHFYKDYPLSAPVTLGIFNGGQFTSGQPEHCLLEGCIEYVPGEKSKDVIQSFEAAVKNACVGDEWLENHPPKIDWFGLLYEPSETPEDDAFIQMAKQSFEKVLKRTPVVNGFEAGTDMRLLRNNFGVPGFMFGAGDLAMAHAPNEFVDIAALIEGAKAMTMMMADWCGVFNI